MLDDTSREPTVLVEHFFRHESGKLMAVLTRAFGVRHLDLIEDTVQEALLTAVESWGRRGVPEHPSAWIYRVARNRVLDALRRELDGAAGAGCQVVLEDLRVVAARTRTGGRGQHRAGAPERSVRV